MSCDSRLEPYCSECMESGTYTINDCNAYARCVRDQSVYYPPENLPDVEAACGKEELPPVDNGPIIVKPPIENPPIDWSRPDKPPPKSSTSQCCVIFAIAAIVAFAIVYSIKRIGN